MNDEKFDRIMKKWVDEEKRAAPPLEPPDSLRQEVRKLRPPPSFKGVLRAARWALIAACLFGLASLVQHFFIQDPTPEDRARAFTWNQEKDVRLKGPGLKIKGVKGPKKRGHRTFKTLLFQYHLKGSKTIQGVNLLEPVSMKIRLKPGDAYRLGLELKEKRHCLILQHHQVLIKKLIPAGQPHYLPIDPQWLQLLKENEKEQIRIFLSEAPFPEDLSGLIENPPEDVEMFEFIFNNPE